MSILVHIIDRAACKEGDVPLHAMLKCGDVKGAQQVDEGAKEMWMATEKILRGKRDIINGMDIPQSEKDSLNLAMDCGESEGSFGPGLDGGLYEMLSTNRVGFPEEMSVERRNELKGRIFKFGCFCRIANNNIQQPTGSFQGDYSSLSVFFRKLFSSCKWSLMDIMKQLTDQGDECIL